jgi:hypothetical protein
MFGSINRGEQDKVVDKKGNIEQQSLEQEAEELSKYRMRLKKKE